MSGTIVTALRFVKTRILIIHVSVSHSYLEIGMASWYLKLYNISAPYLYSRVCSIKSISCTKLKIGAQDCSEHNLQNNAHVDTCICVQYM